MRYGVENTLDLSLVLGIEKFSRSYIDLCFKLGARPPVKILQERLGRQDHCWVGGSENRRFFVWRIEELWILAHNTRGILLEVPTNTSSSRAEQLWELFQSRVLAEKVFLDSGAT